MSATAEVEHDFEEEEEEEEEEEGDGRRARLRERERLSGAVHVWHFYSVLLDSKHGLFERETVVSIAVDSSSLRMRDVSRQGQLPRAHQYRHYYRRCRSSKVPHTTSTSCTSMTTRMTSGLLRRTREASFRIATTFFVLALRCSGRSSSSVSCVDRRISHKTCSSTYSSTAQSAHMHIHSSREHAWLKGAQSRIAHWCVKITCHPSVMSHPLQHLSLSTSTRSLSPTSPIIQPLSLALAIWSPGTGSKYLRRSTAEWRIH